MRMTRQPGDRLMRLQQAPSIREIESIRRAAYAVAADGYKAASDRYYDVHQHQLQAFETMKSSEYALEELRNTLKSRIKSLHQYMDILLGKQQICQTQGDVNLAQDYYRQVDDIRIITNDFKIDIARCDREIERYKAAGRFCEGKAYQVVGPGDDRFKKYQQYDRLSEA